MEDKVRKMVEATLAATQSSRVDDKLEKLAEVSAQMARAIESNAESAS